MSLYHKPVMLNEVENNLINIKDGWYVDGTFGGGGHSSYLLEKHSEIKILGLDCDEDAIKQGDEKYSNFKGRLKLVRENFSNTKKVLDSLGINKVNGILLDLGVSSHQLDVPGRGFSFNSEKLDMRMDSRLRQNAEDLLSTLDAGQLADIFYKYGEERLSRPIGRLIVRERERSPITSAHQLSSIVSKIVKKHNKINPATRVFQAIRIAVNKELENLPALLEVLPEILNPGARVVVLSYHSLEDRIVKNSFRKLAQDGSFKLVTKKIITPAEEEIMNNPRSRSAKLRVVEKI